MAPGRRDEHGKRCSCRLLADAVGCDPKTIRFSFCRTVLAKRWIINCDHMARDEPAEPPRPEWRGVGPIDPVKAILVKNE